MNFQCNTTVPMSISSSTMDPYEMMRKLNLHSSDSNLSVPLNVPSYDFGSSSSGALEAYIARQEASDDSESMEDPGNIFDDDLSVDLNVRQFQSIDVDLSLIKIEPLRAQMSSLFEPETMPTVPDKQAVTNASSTKRWQERYEELVQYKERFGHCCVPSQWVESPPLAQWVKRQRYQLKLRNEGQHSTMSTEREAALNGLGFVWDPHTAFWNERFSELEDFRATHGHANVPTKYPENPQLAIWAKCQRRQMKLYISEGPNKSNMTPDRIEKLNSLGFVFNPRGLKRQSRSSSVPDLLIGAPRRMSATKSTANKRYSLLDSSMHSL
eukprot:Nitzschia sp. Nitz4//scaffold110_size71422//3123//4097//NITZ4_005862-RA/size71422-processed-gene-0.67-mRNA-1//-1//CDS//3329533053//7509//frame0